jgi:diaminopropionate ammonia-lyase
LDVFVNPTVDRRASFHGLFQESAYRAVADFYDSRPNLTPTPLHSLPALAAHLSLADVLIKDETRRFGLEAFKIAGALYAMRTLGAAGLSRGVVCATAGNHGRAVARAAREIGCACTVFVPAEHPRATQRERRTRAARIDGMRRDGAVTSDVAGSYEDAVARAADHARHTGACVVSDTSWEGYETIPRAIMSGYTRLFEEAHQQWTRAPDVVLIQGGVGGLVCAAANWFSWRYGSRRPYLIACEPESAACLLESARAGRTATVQASKPGEVPTMMAGLRCAAPSPAAWPSIQAGIDAFVAVSDAIVEKALDILSHPRPGDTRIISGPSGACGLGALLALLSAPELDLVRRIGALNRSIRVMVVVTEGP